MKRFFVFALGLFLAMVQTALPVGVTVAVNPAIVTNDFVGPISLNISNLVSGHSVRVDRFLDVNGNGAVDAGEPAYQSFIVTNGQLPTIGGVRNVNVPGDEDGSSNTTIQTKVPYPDLSGVLDKIAAKWVYRVTDLSNGNTAANAFTTLQKTNSQGVTGKVVASGSGLPITNCPIVLINLNVDGGSGAMTDAGGNYTLYCTPGEYVALPVAPGVIADESLSFTVVSNAFTTNNLTNGFSDRTISGTVTDSLTATGISGVFIQAETSANLFAVAFTDTNGNYTVQVNSGQWKVKIDGAAGANQGYVVLTNKINVNTTGGSVSGANFQLVKATAMIYGTVKDNQTNTIPGIRLDASPSSGGNDVRGLTDTNGNYSVAILGGNYDIGPDKEALVGLPYAGTSSTNVTVSDGQAMVVNFILQRVTAHLRGFVRYANGNPVTNISLAISPDADTDGSQSLYPHAAPDGSFDAGVFAGPWRVALDTTSAAAANIAGPSLSITVTNGVDQNNIILVVYSTSTNQISGHVVDHHGANLVDIHIFAGTTINGTNYSVGGNTDTNGNYVLNVFPAFWDVGVSGDVSNRGYQQPPDQYANIVGGNSQVVNFTIYPLGGAPPNILYPARFGSQFQFQVAGNASQSYRVEATTNFTTWVPVVTNVGNFFFADTNANNFPRRFYRAREWP